MIGDDRIPICDLHELAGRGRGRIVHFGACETMRASRKLFDRFLNYTQFTAMCGFRHDVDWLHSTALEILILDELSKRKISQRSVRAFQIQLRKMTGSLVRHLGFDVLIRGR